jgi:hypothetical protein
MIIVKSVGNHHSAGSVTGNFLKGSKLNQRAILYGIVEVLYEDWKRAKEKNWHKKDENGFQCSWADTVLADILRQSIKLLQEIINDDNLNYIPNMKQDERLSIHDRNNIYYSSLARAKEEMYGQDFRRKKRSV